VTGIPFCQRCATETVWLRKFAISPTFENSEPSTLASLSASLFENYTINFPHGGHAATPSLTEFLICTRGYGVKLGYVVVRGPGTTSGESNKTGEDLLKRVSGAPLAKGVISSGVAVSSATTFSALFSLTISPGWGGESSLLLT
jgi:hypothetical protein